MKNHYECECCPDEDIFEGQTYLYIRTHPDDNGIEPRPSDMLCAVSPDIIIIKPDGTRGDEGVAGERNHIEVIVTNGGGIPANDAFVEVFYGGPTTGFVATLAQMIGSQYVTVQGYSTSSIRIPWVPTETGHLCLTARVSLVSPPDMYRYPDQFDIPRDRHLAQRNIHIIELKQESSFTFDFDLVNPTIENNGELLLEVQFINVSDKEDIINRALGSHFAHFSDRLFGNINLTVNGQEPHRRDSGVYSVYVPKDKPQKARIFVEKSIDTNEKCDKLHLLEVRLLEYNRRVIGGMWIVINE
ncbi:hypothetical protein [Paenibacillus pabuli]|uniref:hypothetical protein n=1 Tax=Paenibacillus pabuli TaxID=1472 RepID=UPI0007831E80|nr:hypothetical protein [Paenibacillus pabuli]MEC0128481.1 hypothetical protein [Paenibacillus pabuli]